mmetsp:Transcript_38401/g.109770  ORF Transcript_38401/g.109770 Transcript_38401/m.109770 type:complete len:499 (-) Transcript_38401:93-1589(-)
MHGEWYRKNGMEPPFHPYQIASWAIFGLDVALYYVFCIPLLELPAKVGLGLVFGVTSIVVFYTAYMCTVIDPADMNIYALPECVNMNEDDHVCGTCSSYVNKKSKHCRLCNKCVLNFDHHCKWLNNCIGKANYWYFLVLVVAVVVLTGLEVATAASLLGQHLLTDKVEDEWIEAYGEFSAVAFYILLILVCVFNLPLLVLVLQLVLLHIWLIWHDLTTYEYIVLKSRQMQEKMNRMEALRAAGGYADTSPLDPKRLRQQLQRCCGGLRAEGRTDETLPSTCLDWIVFNKRRARRREPKGGSTQPEGHPHQPPHPPQGEPPLPRFPSRGPGQRAVPSGPFLELQIHTPPPAQSPVRTQNGAPPIPGDNTLEPYDDRLPTDLPVTRVGRNESLAGHFAHDVNQSLALQPPEPLVASRDEADRIREDDRSGGGRRAVHLDIPTPGVRPESSATDAIEAPSMALHDRQGLRQTQSHTEQRSAPAEGRVPVAAHEGAGREQGR